MIHAYDGAISIYNQLVHNLPINESSMDNILMKDLICIFRLPERICQILLDNNIKTLLNLASIDNKEFYHIYKLDEHDRKDIIDMLTCLGITGHKLTWESNISENVSSEIFSAENYCNTIPIEEQLSSHFDQNHVNGNKPIECMKSVSSYNDEILEILSKYYNIKSLKDLLNLKDSDLNNIYDMLQDKVQIWNIFAVLKEYGISHNLNKSKFIIVPLVDICRLLSCDKHIIPPIRKYNNELLCEDATKSIEEIYLFDICFLSENYNEEFHNIKGIGPSYRKTIIRILDTLGFKHYLSE